ncbi:hypothetical protein K501DRAFT_253457 [Backusella circina FSU 941]|nr:hypothetical protein K501DRAFT_253457 [Backusella circina FSU 941]
MYDFTVKAHQGVLPVKKLAKFDFLSIWELKQITLLPTRRVFIISDQDHRNAHQYNYVSCDIVDDEHFIFRVCTDDHHSFLLQVKDQSSAERWIAWFNCAQLEEEKNTLTQPITTFGSSYNLSHYINDIQSHYIPPSNSFGVVDDSWQRYP